MPGTPSCGRAQREMQRETTRESDKQLQVAEAFLSDLDQDPEGDLSADDRHVRRFPSERLDREAQAWIHRRLATFSVLALVTMGALVATQMTGSHPMVSANWGSAALTKVEEHAAANPYACHLLYRHPQELQDKQHTPTAVWIDSKAMLHGKGWSSLEGIMEDASWKVSRELVTLVLHNLPNRGCEAAAPRAEICCARLASGECDWAATDAQGCADGLREYREEFVDRFITVLEKFKGTFPVAVVLEPGSSSGLLGRAGEPACRGAGTRFAYREGLRYAVEQLAERAPWVTLYLDAGHGGWLGSHNELVSFLHVLKEMNLPIRRIRGFVTNVGGRRPLGKAACPWQPMNNTNVFCVLGGVGDPCCEDPCRALAIGNVANNELNYAQELSRNAKVILGMDAHVITDTSRNGQSDLAADLLSSCSTCNDEAMSGRPSSSEVHASAAPFLDAYFWVTAPRRVDACGPRVGQDSLPASSNLQLPPQAAPAENRRETHAAVALAGQGVEDTAQTFAPDRFGVQIA